MTIRLEVDGRAEGEPDPLIGLRIIGDHVIKGVLGRGGMGTVYWAEDPDVGRMAIKVLNPDYSARGEIVARFLGEARAASKIGNRYIIKFITKGVLPDGRVFLAMEYLDGAPLDRYLAASGVLTVRHALAILLMVGHALAEAHRCGIVHRDIKPENIFIMSDGPGSFSEAKVLDFGIAKFNDAGYVNGVQTRTGVVMGTPLYMPPEQALGLDVGPQSDLYALALVAHVMLTGSLPQAQLGANSWRDPRELRPDLPAGVAQALLHALEYHPHQRPESISEWLRALVDAVDGGEDLASLYAPGLLRAWGRNAGSNQAMGSAAGTLAGPVHAPAFEKTTLGEAIGARNASVATRSPRTIVLVLASLLVGAVVTVAVWSLASRNGKDSERGDVASAERQMEPPVSVDAAVERAAPDAAAVPVAAPPVVDAGVAVANVPDAAAVDPPEPDAGVRTTADRSRPATHTPKGEGSLRVVVKPWGEAWLDGKRRLGESPIFVDGIPEGRHKLRLSNDTHKETITVKIRDGKTTVVERNW